MAPEDGDAKAIRNEANQTGRSVQAQPGIRRPIDTIRFTGGRIRRVKNPTPCRRDVLKKSVARSLTIKNFLYRRSGSSVSGHGFSRAAITSESQGL